MHKSPNSPLKVDRIDPAILKEAQSLPHETNEYDDDASRERIIQIMEGGKTDCLLFGLTNKGSIWGLKGGGVWFRQNLPKEIDPNVTQ